MKTMGLWTLHESSKATHGDGYNFAKEKKKSGDSYNFAQRKLN